MTVVEVGMIVIADRSAVNDQFPVNEAMARVPGSERLITIRDNFVPSNRLTCQTWRETEHTTGSPAAPRFPMDAAARLLATVQIA
jgi:hypothetical protein